MRLLLANPRGFCAGVDRAIEIVERALALFGRPVYVRHEVVHNRTVVERLRDQGVKFVDELEEVPDGAIVIFSAHGVSQTVRREAEQRDLRVFDATCPLVTKVHLEVVGHCDAGRDVVLVGHRGHPEVEGTLGQWHGLGAGSIYRVGSMDEVGSLQVANPDNIAYVTQTTLSVDDAQEIVGALKKRFPSLISPRHDDICYATQNRQQAVKRLAESCDVVLVVGSPNSSNSNRLRELVTKQGVASFLIDCAEDIDPQWLDEAHCVGITAGASAPESVVQGVVAKVRVLGAEAVEESDGEREQLSFSLPKALRDR